MSEWTSIMLFITKEKIEKLKKYGEANNKALDQLIRDAVDRFIEQVVEVTSESGERN